MTRSRGNAIRPVCGAAAKPLFNTPPGIGADSQGEASMKAVSPGRAAPDYARTAQGSTEAHETQAPAQRRAAWTVLYLAVGLLACSWVWIVNGFPLVFPDTGPYILSGLRLVVPWDRPIWYGLLLRLLRPLGLGGVALLQISAAVIAIRIAFAYLDRIRPWATVALVVLLAGFTSLPWFGPFLVPDIFLSLVVLSIYAILFGGARSGGWRLAGLLLVLLVGVLVHTSHIFIAAFLVAACMALRAIALLLPQMAVPMPPLPAGRIGAIAAVVVAAVLAGVVVNHHAYGRWTLSPGGHVFLMDRFAADGTLKLVLDRHCAEHAFVACRLRGKLPIEPNAYLWGKESPFWNEWQPLRGRLGLGMDDTRVAEELSRTEHEELIRLSLREDPLRHVVATVLAGAKQFFLIRTGNELLIHNPWTEVETAIGLYEPSALPRFLASLQNHMELPIDFSNRLNAVFYGVCALAVAFVLWRDWTRLIRSRSGALLGFVLLAALVNSLVCGGLSGPHDRYQSRLIWLLAACCIALVMEWLFARRGGGEPQDA